MLYCTLQKSHRMAFYIILHRIPIDGPCDVFFNNEGVVKNTTRPESPIKKKHNSVAYYKAHKKELENEKDLSKVSKKILLAIQDKEKEMQNDFEESTMAEELPGLMADKLKENVLKTVNSDEFKSLPQRSMNAFAAFMESEDVQKIKASVMLAIKEKRLEVTKALQDGLESDEMKALQSRASNVV